MKRFVFTPWLAVPFVLGCALQTSESSTPNPSTPSLPAPETAVLSPIALNNLELWFEGFSDPVRNRLHVREFAFCAYGTIRDDTVFVDRVEFPIQEQSRNTVNPFEWASCSEDNRIAWGHSHPSTHCKLSSKDIHLLAIRPEPTTLLVCRHATGTTEHTRVAVWLFTKADLFTLVRSGVHTDPDVVVGTRVVP